MIYARSKNCLLSSQAMWSSFRPACFSLNLSSKCVYIFVRVFSRVLECHCLLVSEYLYTIVSVERVYLCFPILHMLVSIKCVILCILVYVIYVWRSCTGSWSFCFSVCRRCWQRGHPLVLKFSVIIIIFNLNDWKPLIFMPVLKEINLYWIHMSMCK